MLTTYGCLSYVNRRRNDRQNYPEVATLVFRVIPTVSITVRPPHVTCGGMGGKKRKEERKVKGPESHRDNLGIMKHDAIEKKLKPNRR